MLKLKSFVLVIALSAFQCAEATTPEKHGTKSSKHEQACFAEGCFWKTQYVFSKIPGVVHTTVGYTGGSIANPTYQQVCTHTTGHAEACLVEYNPAKVSYQKLLEAFFSSHDPTTSDRQGPDVGNNYRSEIFYENDSQKEEAIAYKNKLEGSGKYKSPIVTAIEPAGKFYKAEDYHQDYFAKHGETCQ